MLSYGKVASAPVPIGVFLALHIVLLGAYRANQIQDWISTDVANWIAVCAAIVLMMLYRFVRRQLRNRSAALKERGLKIGFDVDGVLADQITGVIPRIKRRLGIELEYDDVTDWRLPLGDTDIATEIVSAMADPDYILNMPIHSGAKDVLDQLYKVHHIKVITARPPDAKDWTQAWIDRHALSVDSLSSVKEKEKSLFATDVLVDDYIGNIQEYLTATNGVAILVDQPWNRSRTDLAHFIDEKRLHVVRSLNEVPALVALIQTEQAARD